MIVLDTTVLVYATGAEHPLRSPCRALIEAVTAGFRRDHDGKPVFVAHQMFEQAKGKKAVA